MEANYVHKDSTTLIQDELNQIELQYNALKQQQFNELLKENQELKNQLKKHRNIYIKKVNNFLAENLEPDPEDLYMAELEQRAMDCELMEMQQKEFIKYLEDEIHSCEAVSDLLFNSSKEMKLYKEILQKYKEIIGDAR